MDRLKREGNPPMGQLASPVPQYKDVLLDDWAELQGEGGASYVKDRDALAKLEQARILLSGVATEAKLEEARALLESVAGKDFATQATLAQVKSELELVKAELVTIKANQLSGDQKVQLSGTIVEQGEVARDVIVAPGSEVIVYTDSNKLAAVALSVVVNAKTPHDFILRVIERPASVPEYSSMYFGTDFPSEGKLLARMPKKALSANQRIEYRIRNSSDVDQNYAIARGLWYV